MGIKQVEVYRVTLRNKEPFRISAGTTSGTINIVVKINTDYGVNGWGESSPSKRVTGETADTVLKVLERISPRLIGMCPLRIEQITDVMDSVVEKNPAAKASIDMALYDISGKTAHKPLFMLLGGYRTEVLTDLTLSIKSPREMAKDAASAVEKGFKALKIKLGVNPSEDIERVREIREAVSCYVKLRVDANQGWTTEQAIDVLNKIEKFDIQFAEQPVPSQNLKDLQKVRKNSPVPLMADESVHSPEDALSLIKNEATDLINIKLMKSGGILKARKIAEVAESAGIECMIGCMSESTLGIAAGAHLAAAVRNILHADLDSDLIMKDRLVTKGGPGLSGSMRTFSKVCGLGVEELDNALLGTPVKVYS